MIKKIFLPTVTVFVMSLFTGACDNVIPNKIKEVTLSETEKNVRAAIRREYERPLCFRYSYQYPFELRVMRKLKEKIARADMLYRADILEREEKRRFVNGVGDQFFYKYSLTEKGAKMLNQDFELCFGRSKITEFLDIKEVKPRTYSVTFTIADVTDEDWAQSSAFNGLLVFDPEPKTNRRVVKQRGRRWIVQ